MEKRLENLSLSQIRKVYCKIRKVKSTSLKRKKIRHRIGKKRPNDIVVSIANPNKLMKYILWKPKYNNLTHIVKSSLNWYKKQSR